MNLLEKKIVIFWNGKNTLLSQKKIKTYKHTKKQSKTYHEKKAAIRILVLVIKL
jgi:hypothetical protein